MEKGARGAAWGLVNEGGSMRVYDEPMLRREKALAGLDFGERPAGARSGAEFGRGALFIICERGVWWRRLGVEGGAKVNLVVVLVVLETSSSRLFLVLLAPLEEDGSTFSESERSDVSRRRLREGADIPIDWNVSCISIRIYMLDRRVTNHSVDFSRSARNAAGRDQ